MNFFTLEDETGFVNLVLWKQVFERHAALAKTAALLGVTYLSIFVPVEWPAAADSLRTGIQQARFCRMVVECRISTS